MKSIKPVFKIVERVWTGLNRPQYESYTIARLGTGRRKITAMQGAEFRKRLSPSQRHLPCAQNLAHPTTKLYYPSTTLFERHKVRRIVNAIGTSTIVGANVAPPEVIAAAAEALGATTARSMNSNARRAAPSRKPREPRPAA
jgi:hypothetical protein